MLPDQRANLGKQSNCIIGYFFYGFLHNVSYNMQIYLNVNNMKHIIFLGLPHPFRKLIAPILTY